MTLIDLPTYKSLMGIQTSDTRDDPQITALLSPASKAVETYTGRNFALSSGLSTTRTYLYDGSGILDIDDCTAITNVSVNIPNVAPYSMQPEEWTAMPDTGIVTYYLVLHGGVSPFGISPEMGFERNLDQYPATRFKASTVAITAQWGWPEIPEDVKLAVALTIKQFVSSAGGGSAEGLTAEAIEGFSRSWGARSGATGVASLAVPNRARDLLSTYQRIFV